MLCHSRLDVQRKSLSVVALLSHLYRIISGAVYDCSAAFCYLVRTLTTGAESDYLPELVRLNCPSVGESKAVIFVNGKPLMSQKLLYQCALRYTAEIEGLVGEPIVDSTVVEHQLSVCVPDVASVLYREEVYPVLPPVLELKLL